MGWGLGRPPGSPERLKPPQVVAEPGELPGLAADGGSRVKTKEKRCFAGKHQRAAGEAAPGKTCGAARWCG